MLLVTGDSHETVNAAMSEVKKIFCVGTPQAAIHEVLQLVGDVRPGKESGHEQFVSYTPLPSLQFLIELQLRFFGWSVSHALPPFSEFLIGT